MCARMEIEPMQARRCLIPKTLVLLSLLLSIAGAPRVSRAQAVDVTEQHVTGWVMGTQEERVAASAGDIVILDQGRRRGVEVGDHYIVFDGPTASAHPRTGRLLRTEGDAIGELSVVAVSEQTSKALVVRSIREVNIGARVAPVRHSGGFQTHRSSQSEESMQVQTSLARVTPCMATTRQTVQQAEQAGTVGAVLDDVRRVLGQAERSIEQAQTFIATGDADRATTRLDTALADCVRAAELLQRTGVHPVQGTTTTTPGRS